MSCDMTNTNGKNNMQTIISSYDCVVLDIDQTLVFTSKNSQPQSKTIVFDTLEGDTVTMWSKPRPGLSQFLNYCFEYCDVGVWSAGQSGYVNAIIDSFFPHKPKFIYNWNHCSRNKHRVGGMIYKNLDDIPHHGKILMIDDHLFGLECCDRVDTYIIPQWDPSMTDDYALYKLIL